MTTQTETQDQQAKLESRFAIIQTSACGAVLSPADLKWLAPGCELRRLKVGECIFREGTAPDAVYAINAGTVSLSRVMHERRVTLALLRQGSIFGDEPLLNRSVSAFDAAAVTPVGLLVIPAAQFFNALREVPAFAERWAVWAVRRLGVLQTRLIDLLAGDLQSQVASLILHESCDPHPINLTQQTIAELLGVQRTSVTRVLRELVRRQVISVGYAHIAVTDRRALASIAFGRDAQMKTTSV